MNASNISTENLALTSWAWISQTDHALSAPTAATSLVPPQSAFDLWRPIRNWLDQLDIQDVAFAHSICKMIPAQCPFERDIQVFGRTLFHIPPMCKLNPVYEQVVGLRFRALCYLADVCGEDITPYC